MCPVCLTTMAVIVTGSTSAGSFTGLTMKLAQRRGQEDRDPDVVAQEERQFIGNTRRKETKR